MKYAIMKILDRIVPAAKASAHCDIPCGIYDPHIAQMAAHTVIRMVTLINENKDDAHKVARFTAVKEQHAEICKHEIRVLWGDYFKPEHIQKYPNLHDLVWKTLKLASKARQEADVKAADELLESVNKVAEIFWEAKGMGTARFKAPYPTERETVYPVSKKGIVTV
ncbi:MAG: superoxide dismutase, Ni [Candidatus Aenigmarchaeota archaeon]|nr:superoxide dismutase, Ni [Candidatus Aenigmarchaeota archaeon]